MFLIKYFWARYRERPGHSRVAIQGMSGNQVIVPDEGGLTEATKHWVTYKVGWVGACMIAERYEYSNFQVLMQAELFDEKGNRITTGGAFYYFNSAFESENYEVYKNEYPCKDK